MSIKDIVSLGGVDFVAREVCRIGTDQLLFSDYCNVGAVS